MPSRWVIRTGTAENGTETHVAFLAAAILSVPGLVILLVVAARMSGLSRLVAVLAAVALGLLIVWDRHVDAVAKAIGEADEFAELTFAGRWNVRPCPDRVSRPRSVPDARELVTCPVG